jgi:hypothetical protein
MTAHTRICSLWRQRQDKRNRVLDDASPGHLVALQPEYKEA